MRLRRMLVVVFAALAVLVTVGAGVSSAATAIEYGLSASAGN